MSLPSSGEVTRLTVLSLLSTGDFHGYALREVMEAWHMDSWADIRYGSIYQALRTMAKDGLVEELATEAEGKRPPKTVYHITDSGREELRRLVRHAWSEPSRYVEPINVALSFLPLGLLDDKEIIGLLDERLARLDAVAAQLGAEEKAGMERSDDPGMNAALSDHFAHFQRLLETEREWTLHIRKQLRRGAYRIGRRPRR